jgi:hypothetical protein
MWFTRTEADNVNRNNLFRLRVNRNPNDPTDNMAGDAQILRVVLR